MGGGGIERKIVIFVAAGGVTGKGGVGVFMIEVQRRAGHVVNENFVHGRALIHTWVAFHTCVLIRKCIFI